MHVLKLEIYKYISSKDEIFRTTNKPGHHFTRNKEPRAVLGAQRTIQKVIVVGKFEIHQNLSFFFSLLFA